MRISRISQPLSLLIACFILGHTALSQTGSEHCKLILQNGLYKTYGIVKTGNFTQDIKSYFNSSTFKQDLRNGRWEGNVGVIVEGVPISVGAGSSDQEIAAFQQRIASSNTLSLSQSFYDQVQIAVPDVEMAKAYTECLGKTAEYGFKVIPTINERDVIFVVTYRKQNSIDPMPKVMLFNLKNGTGVTKSFNVGDLLQDSNAITADRNPEKDLTLIIQTDKGSIVYPVPADPVGFNKDIPVGSIISSFLNWTEFQNITQNNANNPAGPFWSSKYSKWAPADGRQVPGSRFAGAASQQNVPDLRGMFIRGLNSFDPADEPVPVEATKRDPETRSRGSYQSDSFKEHDHGGGNHTHKTGVWNGAATNFGGPIFRTNGQDNINDPSTPVNSSGNIINREGGGETRPKNMAIYYYIRIN